MKMKSLSMKILGNLRATLFTRELQKCNRRSAIGRFSFSDSVDDSVRLVGYAGSLSVKIRPGEIGQAAQTRNPAEILRIRSWHLRAVSSSETAQSWRTARYHEELHHYTLRSHSVICCRISARYSFRVATFVRRTFVRAVLADRFSSRARRSDLLANSWFFSRHEWIHTEKCMPHSSKRYLFCCCVTLIGLYIRNLSIIANSALHIAEVTGGHRSSCNLVDNYCIIINAFEEKALQEAPEARLSVFSSFRVNSHVGR